MTINRHNFSLLRPQDFQDDAAEIADFDDPDAYLSPFLQTRLGIWVYRFHGKQWLLYAIEMSAQELAGTTEAERSRISSYYGLSLSPQDVCTMGDGCLHLVADYGKYPSSTLMFVYIDGLLYSTIHDADGNFLSLAVCSVASDRKDRLLPEAVASIEDILVTKDSLDGVGFLDIVLANFHSGKIITRTGVFLSKVENVDHHN